MLVPAGGRDGPVKCELTQSSDGLPAHATSPKPSQGKETTGLEKAKARPSSTSPRAVWYTEKTKLMTARNSRLAGKRGRGSERERSEGKEDTAREDKARQDEQDKTRQDITRQDKPRIRYDKTRQGKTAQDKNKTTRPNTT